MRRALLALAAVLALGACDGEGVGPDGEPSPPDEVLDDDGDGTVSEVEGLDYAFDNLTSRTTGAAREQGNPDLVAWVNEWVRRMAQYPDLDPFSPPVTPPPYDRWVDGRPPPPV